MSSKYSLEEINDLTNIIGVANSDVDEAIHAVEDNSDAIFTWDYEKGARPALNKLYEKAKHSQWNGETDLDWSIDVEPRQVLSSFGAASDDPRFGVGGTLAQSPDLPFAKFSQDNWDEMAEESVAWRLAQFMHGEQGALVCTAKIVETVPWIDAKYYAATQVMDEARHVEVFAKYLDTKLEKYYPINHHLGALLDDIVSDSRWDMTYLGMQIMVEGLALAAFGFMYQMTDEPLLKKLLRYVMSDEARHVAFGVLSLKEYYADLTQAELQERQEFAFEAALRMRNRFLQQEVWERMGIPVKPTVKALIEQAPEDDIFQQMLFSKVVPNCKKLGLLDAGDGWLRQKFGEINVLQFEDEADTGADYETFDAVAADRATQETADGAVT